MDTFFIHPNHQLSHEVYQEVVGLEGRGLFISPRGEYDLRFEEPRLYGVYVNNLEFVQNYYRSGGLWGYELLDDWLQSYRQQYEF